MQKHPQIVNDLRGFAAELFEISEEIATKISDTGSNQGIFCVCEMPAAPSHDSTCETGSTNRI